MRFLLCGMLCQCDADAHFELTECDCGCAWRRPGSVGFARWCGEFGCVSVGFVDTRTDPPAGGFLGVVAAFARAAAVIRGGGAAAGPRLRMVAVPDRRVAVGRAAALISQVDESRQTARKNPRPRLHGHQRPR